MNQSLRIALASALVVVAVGTGGCRKEQAVESAPLLCYVGGTMRLAMEKLAAIYTDKTGKKIDLDFADSGSNLARIRMEGKADLYVAHDPFGWAVLHEGLGTRGWNVAVLTPVIVVAKGNPQGITGLEDLARPGLKIALTDANYSTLGHINPVMFAKTGVAEGIGANVATTMRMGGEVANAVAIGRFDAGLVWNAVAHSRGEKLDVIEIAPAHRPDPQIDAVTAATFGRVDMSSVKVFIATLAGSSQPDHARKFAEFVASDEGRAVFIELGYSPIEQLK